MKNTHTLYSMILLCATLSLLLGCILIDPGLKPDDEPGLADIQLKLDLNREKWMSKMVSNYEFYFQRHCFCFEDDIAPVIISVRDNRIVDVNFVGGNALRTIKDFDDYLTVEGLFDFVQEKIDEKVDSISAEYHSELGYPTEVWIDHDIGADDDGIGFEIRWLSIK
ncbi:hypothetical protein J4G02_22570 [Candidatus Poribacteria bacterium]|nr:hypothetical protein [Candidatus Poribacteria bacterium]